MVEMGYTNESLASYLGINPSTLHRKLTGTSDFTRYELQLIRHAFALTNNETEDIFFAE